MLAPVVTNLETFFCMFLAGRFGWRMSLLVGCGAREPFTLVDAVKSI
jgi:hypothetical protein